MSRTAFRQHSLPAVCAAALLQFASLPAAAELRAHLSLATESPYRGLRYTLSGGVVQGGFEYRVGAGFFAGAWAGRTDYEFNSIQSPGCDSIYIDQCTAADGTASDVNMDLASDYYIGYQHTLSKRYSYDITLTRHAYHGSAQADTFDWNELSAGINIDGRWVVSAGISNRWLNVRERAGYLEFGYLHPLPFEVTLDATLGLQNLKKVVGQNITYTEIGLTKPFKSLSLRLAYSAADRNAEDIFGKRVDDIWYACISWVWGS